MLVVFGTPPPPRPNAPNSRYEATVVKRSHFSNTRHCILFFPTGVWLAVWMVLWEWIEWLSWQLQSTVEWPQEVCLCLYALSSLRIRDREDTHRHLKKIANLEKQNNKYILRSLSMRYMTLIEITGKLSGVY